MAKSYTASWALVMDCRDARLLIIAVFNQSKSGFWTTLAKKRITYHYRPWIIGYAFEIMTDIRIIE